MPVFLSIALHEELVSRPRRWGQKKVPKGSSRYVSASESRVPEPEAKIGR